LPFSSLVRRLVAALRVCGATPLIPALPRFVLFTRFMDSTRFMLHTRFMDFMHALKSALAALPLVK
jgi:hypothetical protein